MQSVIFIMSTTTEVELRTRGEDEGDDDGCFRCGRQGTVNENDDEGESCSLRSCPADPKEGGEAGEASCSPFDGDLPTIVPWNSQQESESDDLYCRICFEGPEEKEPLFRACNCKGSVAYVHHRCLSKWVADSQRLVCELCQAKFRVPPGIKPFIPKTAILHKACTVAADSLTRSAALINLLPQGSGAVTSNSSIIYLRGYGHSRDCGELGFCQFPTSLPPIIDGHMTSEEWKGAIDKINRVSIKMINIGWRFMIFILCLVVNVSLIVILSFIDHAVVIPFMFAVIMIQLLPAVLFGWVASHHNANIHAQLINVCSELTDQYATEGITFGFHTITSDLRSRSRLFNPYSVHPIGEPKVIKFLTVERGTITLAIE